MCKNVAPPESRTSKHFVSPRRFCMRCATTDRPTPLLYLSSLSCEAERRGDELKMVHNSVSRNLTQLRERLEKIQAQGEAGLSQEDAELISRLDQAAGADDDEDGTASEDGCDVVNREEIGSDRPDSDSEPDLSRSPQREEDSDRLRHIEQMLHQQSAMLSELLQRVDQVRAARHVVLEDPSPLEKMRSCDMERAISGIVSEVQSILEQNDVIDEETEQRFALPPGVPLRAGVLYVCPCGVNAATLSLRAQQVRESVVLSTAALFPNVPRSLIDAQLGPLIADVLDAFSSELCSEVADELSADVVRVLYSELGFFFLINSLNCIPDPYPRL
ncbi:unnamed protein product [Heligmosomoides polygyrus]|uniref:Dynactin domain-containing protein n=1 Tax=Heligmosomoides polygyrus TaxID=6339 RepID=A0A3P8EMH4_HELPZ|nr:unnamed protein product [Heligmosomoides polygyrus]